MYSSVQTVMKMKNDHHSKLLKLENLLRWSFFTFLYNRSSNMNYFIYTSHHLIPHRRYELNELTLLPMCGFIAQLVDHRTGIRGVHGFESRWSPDFFRLLLSYYSNWKIYCGDHSSLSSTTAVQILLISHILHITNCYVRNISIRFISQIKLLWVM